MKRVRYSLALCSIAIALYSYTSAGDFLNITRSARAMSLGDSYFAVNDDPAVIEYNPAALNLLYPSITAMYQYLSLNNYSLYLAGNYAIDKIYIGTSIYYMSYNEFIHYDSYGFELNRYKPYDIAIRGAVSVPANIFLRGINNIMLGSGIIYVHRGMVEESANMLALDIGFLLKTRLKMRILGKLKKRRFNVGVSLKNIGFTDIDSPMPFKIGGGFFVEVFDNLYTTMSLWLLGWQSPSFGWGVEYNFRNIVFGRIGLIIEDSPNISVGIGISYPLFDKNIRVDYSLKPYKYLKNANIISLNVAFPSMGKDKAELHYQRGLYYYTMNDYDMALKEWETALIYKPNDSRIKSKINSLRALLTIKKIWEIDLDEKEKINIKEEAGSFFKRQEEKNSNINTNR